MKRVAIFVLGLVLFAMVATAEHRFMFTVNGNYLTFADDYYRDEFGKAKIFPEGKIAMRFSGNFYLWGSYGYLSTSQGWQDWSSKGVFNRDLDCKIVMDKHIISGGLGFFAGYIRPHDFSVQLELGVCKITNNVETTKNYIDSNESYFHEKRRESGIGARGNIGITYGLIKSFYAEAVCGYLYATDKIDGDRFFLGGLRLSLGIGVAF